MRLPKTGNEAKSVKAPVKKLLDKHGWFWWSPPANQFGRSGISDIHAIREGMFMVIETKFGKNDPSEMQLAFLNSVRAEHHFGFVVRDSTIKEFENFLVYLDKSIEVAAKGLVPGPEIGGPLMDAINEMTRTEVLDPAKFARAMKRRAQ